MLLALSLIPSALVTAANPRFLAPTRLNPLYEGGIPLGFGTPSPGQFANAAFSGFSLNLRPLKEDGTPATTDSEVETTPRFATASDDQAAIVARLRSTFGGASYQTDYVQGSTGIPETTLGADGEVKQLFRKVSYGRVPRPFPLRLIVHQGTNSPLVRMLQRIYVGLRKEGTNEYAAVLSSKEGALDSQNLSSARRISTAHLPWSDGNATWSFAGTLAPGGVMTAQVTLSYDDQASNPFLHTYHPDHDNKNALFNATQPQGYESYTVTRDITLRFTPPAGDFESLTRGASQLGGVFEESLTFQGKGDEAKQYDVRGGFVLNRISDIDHLITD